MGLREVLASGNGKDESRNRWRQIRLRERGVLAMAKPHHDQQASDDENPTERGQDQILLKCFCCFPSC